MGKLLKSEYQEWLGNFSFSHLITIEPTPSFHVPFDEMNQRIRKILFDLNKKQLKSRSFPKWKPEDKFWMFGFKEGDGENIEHHYHLLLHSPNKTRSWFPMNSFNDIIFGWMKYPAINPRTGKKRKLVQYRKDKYLEGNDILVPHFPIDVKQIDDSVSACVYASKKFDASFDNHFVIGVSEK